MSNTINNSAANGITMSHVDTGVGKNNMKGDSSCKPKNNVNEISFADVLNGIFCGESSSVKSHREKIMIISEPSRKKEKQPEASKDIPEDILAGMDAAYKENKDLQDTNMDSQENTACKRRIAFIRTLRTLKKKQDSTASLARISKAMDESHEGMREMKDRLLAQTNYAIRTGITPRPTLLVGEPGCGKTSLSVSFAKALGHGYSVISVGGVPGSFPISGSDLGWKGAQEGKVMDAFLQTKCLNPVIIIDEIDKMGNGQEYGTVADALLPILEKSQARFFKDNYLEFPYDVSNAWLILTANYIDQVPEPIIDRCNVIMMPSFGVKMKEDIFKSLVKRKNAEIAPSSISVNEDAVEHIITCFCGDAGARGVTKCADKLFEDVVMGFPKNGKATEKKVTLKDVMGIFKRKPTESNYDFTMRSGSVSGLAVNSVENIGLIMPVEAETFPSDTMKLVVTGQAKTVMQESAMIAVRLADRISMERNGKRIGEVSVNYPYAIEKDGDSAGLATTIAILSSSWKKHVNPKVAITGSVALSGQVLPVGGIMAKVRAAIDAGYTDIVIPKANEKDWLELPASERDSISMHPVSTVQETVGFLLSAPKSKAKAA